MIVNPLCCECNGILNPLRCVQQRGVTRRALLSGPWSEEALAAAEELVEEAEAGAYTRPLLSST